MLGQATKEYLDLLDLADKARGLLVRSGAAGDGKDGALEKVLDHIPQVVVVGAQSAGKSSVLSRLSGVTFPTNAERCTRVATVLKLRRNEQVDSKGQEIKVRLVGKVGEEEVDEAFHSGTTEENIKAAQEVAVKKAAVGDGFVETLEIEVAVEGAQLCNLTLVDLPGLLADKPDNDGPATADRIVKRYANMQGSLILFIVPVSQDYDTVLGQAIVANLKDKTTVVITKMDKLDVKDAQSRLQKIVNETSEPRVVVKANVGVGEEAKALVEFRKVTEAFAGEFDVGGCVKLAAIMEGQMRAHLTVQMPFVEELIVAQRDAKMKHVASLEPREKFQTMLMAKTAIEESLTGSQKGRDMLMRESREKIHEGVTSAFPRVAGRVLEVNDEEEIRKVLEGVGEDKYYEALLSKGFDTIKSCKDELTHQDLRDVGMILYSPRVNVLNAFQEDRTGFSSSDSEIIAEYIEDIVKHQGLRNTVNADPQPVLEHFAGLWGDMYKKILRKVGDELYNNAINMVKKAFDVDRREIPDEAKAAVEKLCNLLLKDLDSIRNEANKCIARLVRYSRPPLVFTTNEHYLTSVYADLVTQFSEDRPTDDSSAELLYLKWLAYRKVQVKVIVEAAAKDLIGLYTVDFDEMTRQSLEAFLSTSNVSLVTDEPKLKEIERKKAKHELEELDKLLMMFNM